MSIKLAWNRLASLFKLGKASKIRPDNLALFSTRKVFFGNPHKAESYMLREGIDAIGLRLVLVPKNASKVKEMIDLAHETSSAMTPRQMRRVESLLFDFLYNKPGYSVSAHLKSMLEDFSRMVITTFKFAESNERSVESTFFLYIIANSNFSVIKDMIVLIGLLTLYVPLVYWGLYLRLAKNLAQLRRFFHTRRKQALFEVIAGILGPVCLNLALLLLVRAAAEWLFLADASVNPDFCFARDDLHFQSTSKLRFVDSSPHVAPLVRGAYDLLIDLGLNLGRSVDNPVAVVQVKVLVFAVLLVAINLAVFLLKRLLLSLLRRDVPNGPDMRRLVVGLEETFTRLFLGVFVATHGIYK